MRGSRSCTDGKIAGDEAAPPHGQPHREGARGAGGNCQSDPSLQDGYRQSGTARQPVGRAGNPCKRSYVEEKPANFKGQDHVGSDLRHSRLGGSWLTGGARSSLLSPRAKEDFAQGSGLGPLRSHIAQAEDGIDLALATSGSLHLRDLDLGFDPFVEVAIEVGS